MINVKIELPDGRTGHAEVQPYASLKELKECICKDVGIENHGAYYLVIVPNSEGDNLASLLSKGITLKFVKCIKWEEQLK